MISTNVNPRHRLPAYFLQRPFVQEYLSIDKQECILFSKRTFFRGKNYLGFIFMFMLFFCGSMQAQPLPEQPFENCAEAQLLIPNEPIVNSNAQSSVNLKEVPAGFPQTCIETYENDQWYYFKTIAGNHSYKIQINTLACNSPAGLQALIIESESCDPDSYEYLDCSNKHKTGTYELFLSDSIADKRILVYVDGYDGAQCKYEIELTVEAAGRESLGWEYFRDQSIDYDQGEVSFEPEELQIEFSNNEVNISWRDDASSAGNYMQIQQLVPYPGGEVAWVRESYQIDPNVVGQAGTYTFWDTQKFENKDEVCYRLCKIDPQGNKFYSEKLCVIVDNIEDFYVNTPAHSPVPGKYAIHYTNNKKQDLYFTLLNAKKEQIKKLVRKREPVHQNLLSLDMTPYPPGVYYLEVRGKKGTFLREFLHE